MTNARSLFHPKEEEGEGEGSGGGGEDTVVASASSRETSSGPPSATIFRRTGCGRSRVDVGENPLVVWWVDHHDPRSIDRKKKKEEGGGKIDRWTRGPGDPPPKKKKKKKIPTTTIGFSPTSNPTSSTSCFGRKREGEEREKEGGLPTLMPIATTGSAYKYPEAAATRRGWNKLRASRQRTRGWGKKKVNRADESPWNWPFPLYFYPADRNDPGQCHVERDGES